jgi:DNA repair protein RecN (Recombination protein N)
MIRKLKIQNLILVERAEIVFGPGLNILTGETGSGKSAILTAIRLILGERADVQWIRKGADLAVVEAEVGEHLVRRELHKSGRSRSFIDDELVPLQELKALPIELVDQSSSISSSNEREYLDLFGDVPSCKAEFDEWSRSQKKLEELLELQKKGDAEQKKIAEDVAFLQEVNWKKGEEEALQQEHHLLTHAAELLEKTGRANTLLSECLPALKRAGFDALIKIEPKFQECAEWFKTGLLNLDEVQHFLASYLSRIEVDPQRLERIEDRIGEIESVKRRFGSFERVEEFLRESNQYSNLVWEIEEAQKNLAIADAKLTAKTTAITQKRKSAKLADAILHELQSLNLPDARMAIEILPKTRSETGADAIRYLFAANPGQPLLPLDQCASGGELSRLLFAVKTVLGHKEKSTCLIFDEIDSNVGGKTAAILGSKLQTLSRHLQLICVTHFVQVAKCALDHFLVSKKTTPLGATTLIEKLNEKSRALEYQRMMGTSL